MSSDEANDRKRKPSTSIPEIISRTDDQNPSEESNKIRRVSTTNASASTVASLQVDTPLVTANAFTANTASAAAVGAAAADDDDDDDDDDDENTDPAIDTPSNNLALSVTKKRRQWRQWTTEEDAILTTSFTNTPVKRWGDKTCTDWMAISAQLSGRTNKECEYRWYQLHGSKNWPPAAALLAQIQCLSRLDNVLNPSFELTADTLKQGLTRGWTEDEDVKLEDAVRLNGGKNWAAIAIQGRTSQQCYCRWDRVLKPNIDPMAKGLPTRPRRMPRWTKDEDLQLLQAVVISVQMYGRNYWPVIATSVQGRTDIQCSGRWRKLEKKRTGA
jgi:hypothetical protein